MAGRPRRARLPMIEFLSAAFVFALLAVGTFAAWMIARH